MASMASSSGNEALREKLRSASELDIARLPQLSLVGKEWANAAQESLATIAAAPSKVRLTGMESGEAPTRDDGMLYAPIMVRRSPLNGFVSFEMAHLDILISMLFGGTPSESDTPRAATELDRSLVKALMERFVLAGARAIGRAVPVSLRLGDLGGLSQIAPVREDDQDELPDARPSGDAQRRRFAVFRFELESGKSKAVLTVALPENVLAMHRKALSQPLPVPRPDRDESWAAGIRENFVETDMRIEAQLARMTVSLRQVAELKPGQTLPLNVGPADAITLSCEERGLVKGHIGHSQGRYVVRVSDRIHPDEEFFDGILSR